MWNVEFVVIEEWDNEKKSVRYRLHARIGGGQIPVGELHDSPLDAAAAFIEGALHVPEVIVKKEKAK